MNRTKKITLNFKKKSKKANAKLHSSNKPKYISKAERERLDEGELTETGIDHGADKSSEPASET
ncbi:Protein of unknown function (DUF2986) [Shewanella psychrophila]|uniref:DUF2986 domain-containing protein n=1 Tax=Shewanella psychrophila TaxID=225848 RepID=A0A1S6HYC0_9GAMM|nr:DUF2986 domain-containing protein [Shewanella psychrophila]AQS40550.1 Protein of unknown function (DUF2986) [Shewanella psychrophila]